MESNRIREIRKEKGITQNELADKIGVKRAVISKYENGVISPSLNQIQKIADVLNVETVDLLSTDDKRNVSEIFELTKDAIRVIEPKKK